LVDDWILRPKYITSSNNSLTFLNSSLWNPLDVIAGVPNRIPEGLSADVSVAIIFLLTDISHNSANFSYLLPVIPFDFTSIKTIWLSVPPVIIRYPFDISSCAKVLETDCKKYNMSSCTVDGIDQAQILKAQEEQSSKALAESQKQFTQTQAALSQVIDLPSQVQSIKPIQELEQPQWQQMQIQELEQPQELQETQPVQDNSIIYIIIFLVILCVLVLSSSSFALFAIKKK
jgi:hypothetical protein